MIHGVMSKKTVKLFAPWSTLINELEEHSKSAKAVECNDREPHCYVFSTLFSTRKLSNCLYSNFSKILAIEASHDGNGPIIT